MNLHIHDLTKKAAPKQIAPNHSNSFLFAFPSTAEALSSDKLKLYSPQVIILAK